MARKTARAGETRDEQSRRGEARRPLKNRHTGQLHIPDHIKKEAKGRGMRLRWIAETVHGQENSQAVTPRLMNGWKAVPASRYPDLAVPTLPGKQPEEIIRRGGQILMEKPAREVKEDEEDLRRENMAEMRAVKWADQAPDPTMPRFDTSGAPVIENVTSQRPGGAQFQDDE